MAVFEEDDMKEWNSDAHADKLHSDLFSSGTTSGKKKAAKRKKILANMKKMTEPVPEPRNENERRKLYQKRRKKWQQEQKKKLRAEKENSETDGPNQPTVKNTDIKVDKKKKAKKKKSKSVDGSAINLENTIDKASPTKIDSSKEHQEKLDKKGNMKPTNVKNTKRERNKYKHLAGQGKRINSSADIDNKPVKQTDSDENVHDDTLSSPKISVKKRKRKADFKIKSTDSDNNIHHDTPSSPKISEKKRKRKADAEILLSEVKKSKGNNSKGSLVSKNDKKDKDKNKHGRVQSPVSSHKSPFQLQKLKTILQANKNSIEALESSRESSKEIEATGVNNSSKKIDQQKKLTFKEKMEEKLKSARFRYINEQLYTTTSADAKDLFLQDRESFFVYHQGFQTQVEKWPVNPVEKMISYIKSKPKNLVVADFGCGDAKLAQGVANKVHSFDLVAVNKHVTPCDMAKVPLKDKTVDIAVFCLSLMGTNLVDFLCEANRVLKNSGKLLIAEVVSRFEKIGPFTRNLEKLGFTLVTKDTSNKMFVWLELVKTQDLEKSSNLPDIELMPCTYKKR